MQPCDDRCPGIEILLVDDDEVFREALAENFRADGHEVEECGSPAAALTAMRDRDFAVLITDYTMQGGTGMDLADRFHGLREKHAVIVTGYPNPILHTQVGSRAYVKLLHKPVDYAELHDLVHRLLDGA